MHESERGRPNLVLVQHTIEQQALSHNQLILSLQTNIECLAETRVMNESDANRKSRIGSWPVVLHFPLAVQHQTLMQVARQRLCEIQQHCGNDLQRKRKTSTRCLKSYLLGIKEKELSTARVIEHWKGIRHHSQTCFPDHIFFGLTMQGGNKCSFCDWNSTGNAPYTSCW